MTTSHTGLAQVAGLHACADESCPVMNVLRKPVEIELVVASPGS